MFRTKFSSLKLVLACICKESTVLAIKFVCNDSHEYLVFHQEAILIFLESDIKLKGAVVSTPSMITFITPEFEKPFFGSFLDLKLFVVPLIFIILTKESCKCFL